MSWLEQVRLLPGVLGEASKVGAPTPTFEKSLCCTLWEHIPRGLGTLCGWELCSLEAPRRSSQSQPQPTSPIQPPTEVWGASCLMP